MKRQTRRAAILVVLLVVITLGGCGGIKKVKITGTVMKNGQALVVEPGNQVKIIFLPDDDSQGQIAKFYRSKGAYEIEVLPGKYHINYLIIWKDKEKEIASPDQKAKFYDLTQDQDGVDIDVK